MTTAEPLALTHREQLIALFAGEQEDGEWVTTPCYTIPLCLEIAKVVDPGSVLQLRHAIFGNARPPDAIDPLALEVLQLAWARFQQFRQGQRGTSRGL